MGDKGGKKDKNKGQKQKKSKQEQKAKKKLDNQPKKTPQLEAGFKQVKISIPDEVRFPIMEIWI